MKVLVTGSAGFIGFHLVKRLLETGHKVTGIDNINSYYDPELKYARLAETGIDRNAEIPDLPVMSSIYPDYTFIRMNLEDKEQLENLFSNEKFDWVCNLAAQAGVRYSIENPSAYITSNVVGFLNILEACRKNNIKHLVYASSSSVYGNSTKMPFSVNDRVDKPVSLYAATKKSNELMAYTYSHLYQLPATGLRFFTVYGPWGRPDMAPILFSSSIMKGVPIKVFNHGNLERDFTYIDDIVDGILKVFEHPTVFDSSVSDDAPHSLYNIGNGNPVRLLDFIEILEKELGYKAVKEFWPMQPGDVYRTWADVSELQKQFGYKPATGLEKGISEFASWFKKYYYSA